MVRFHFGIINLSSNWQDRALSLLKYEFEPRKVLLCVAKWQTRQTQNLMFKYMWVQVPPHRFMLLGNIKVVFGPAKSKVGVQVPSQSRLYDGMVDIVYLGCIFCGFESHQSYFFLFGYSLMVEQWSPKSLMWVRLLLPSNLVGDREAYCGDLESHCFLTRGSNPLLPEHLYFNWQNFSLMMRQLQVRALPGGFFFCFICKFSLLNKKL